jgi:ATPase subunit of ABC transporter with duplicated ATPase domains
MNSVASAIAVSFEFANGHELFQNLNFSLGPHISGLVGPNGVGKTSLARILAGELQPTAGVVRRHSAVTYFQQRLEPPSIEVQEFLGPDLEWSQHTHQLLEGIPLEALCTTLSGGEWMRVRLACRLDDQFLILDEPTNDLDRESRQVLLRFLSEHSAGVLLISHDRECLSLCQEILELSNQGLSKFGGDWSTYLEFKRQERRALDRALEVAKHDRTKAQEERVELRTRQEKRNREGTKAAARGGLPKILLGARKRKAQATTGKVNVETFERVHNAVTFAHEALSDLKTDPVMYASFQGLAIPAQKLVAEAQAYNIHFKNWLYENDLNFRWRGNVRIAIKGANGSGKSTLLKAILGGSFVTRGELKRTDIKTVFVDQRCDELADSLTVFENVRETSTLSESEIRNGLAKFLFQKETALQMVSELSGGERLRAALAKAFLATDKPELLILDEPTNNLDLANIEFLENLVRQFRGALIAISHDEVFLGNCGIEEVFKVS